MSIGASKNFAVTAPSVTFTAFITPSSILTVGPAGGLTSSNVTCSTTGGVDPLTFAWLKISGDAIGVDNPTEQTTTFNASGSAGQQLIAVYRCTVTDDVAAERSADITVRFTFINK